MGRHYVSDVVAGVALGIVTTAIVTQVGLGVLLLHATASVADLERSGTSNSLPWLLTIALGPQTTAPSPCTSCQQAQQPALTSRVLVLSQTLYYCKNVSMLPLLPQGTFRLSGALISEAASERWHRLAEAALHNPYKQWPMIVDSVRHAFKSVVTRFLYTVFPEV